MTRTDPANSRGSSLRSSARRLRLRELSQARTQLGPELPINQFADLAATAIVVGERERAANFVADSCSARAIARKAPTAVVPTTGAGFSGSDAAAPTAARTA